VRVELHPDARAELRSAALWYEERRAGLGDEFVAEISAALDRISRGPESNPRWPGTSDRQPLIRKLTTRRFPYVIAFEQHEGSALVLAIAHAKRRPLYWLARTGS
jgi:plasmid stabilization system protein ParE